MINVIITMAGNGQRFRDAGYDCPKYEIIAHGRTLFEWSMHSLASFWANDAQAIFVTQQAHQAGPFIERHAARCGIKRFQVVELDSLTDGQATSALAATGAIQDPGLPIAVFNIDTFVKPAYLDVHTIRGHGWIPCFPGEGKGWSFARVTAEQQVLELREKERISEWATVGLYHFSSFALYEAVYRQHFATAAGAEKGERYIAPMYNTLLTLHPDVFIACLPKDAVIPMGTPAELEAFRQAPPNA